MVGGTIATTQSGPQLTLDVNYLMYDPKKVLTEAGYRRFFTHIDNIRMAWDFLHNHEGDLHTFALDSDEKFYDMFYSIPDFLDRLEKGPFEENAY
jgi:hypothetical protein